MPSFRYEAYDGAGSLRSGTLDAPDKRGAHRQLTRQGLQANSLEVAASGGDATSSSKAKKDRSKERGPAAGATPLSRRERNQQGPPLRAKELLFFTEEFTDLLDAGLPIEEALRVMETRSEAGRVAEVSTVLRSQLRDGAQPAAAFARASPSFDSLYCAIADAGAASGSLPELLERHARFLKSMQELRARVIASLTYPAVLMASTALLVGVFIFYLLPKFAGFLTELGKDEPGVIGMVLLGGEWVRANVIVLTVVFVLLALLFVAFLRSPSLAPKRERLALRLPALGGVVRDRFRTQYLQTLGSLLGSGIPLVDALQLSSRIVPSRTLQQPLEEMISEVRDGRPLHRALGETGLFPPATIDIVRVGEQTGRLPHSLDKAGQRAETSLQTRLQRITALIQPTIVTLMALLVGAVAWFIITGVFSVLSNIGGQ